MYCFFTLVRTSYSWAFDVPEDVAAVALLVAVGEVLDRDGLAYAGGGDPCGDGRQAAACAAFVGNPRSQVGVAAGGQVVPGDGPGA